MANTATARSDDILDLKAGDVTAKSISERVNDLTIRIKKIATSDDGKLQISLESEAMSDDALSQVKDMLVLQQNGLVKLTMKPVQRELFD